MLSNILQTGPLRITWCTATVDKRAANTKGNQLHRLFQHRWSLQKSNFPAGSPGMPIFRLLGHLWFFFSLTESRYVKGMLRVYCLVSNVPVIQGHVPRYEMSLGINILLCWVNVLLFCCWYVVTEPGAGTACLPSPTRQSGIISHNCCRLGWVLQKSVFLCFLCEDDGVWCQAHSAGWNTTWVT